MKKQTIVVAAVCGLSLARAAWPSRRIMTRRGPIAGGRRACARAIRDTISASTTDEKTGKLMDQQQKEFDDAAAAAAGLPHAA